MPSSIVSAVQSLASASLDAIKMSDTDVIVEETTTPVTNEGGDHERFAHYVRKNEIMPSAIEGTPLTALCGKKWVPSRDPERYPTCPDCKEIYNSMKK